MPLQHHLIDVRSPSEFSTGHLTSDLSPITHNIEYTTILTLPSVLSAANIPLDKTADHFTLYCRSGRRSGIAAKVLKDEGYVHVRDIGGWDDARRTLDREQVERQLEGMMGDVDVSEGQKSGNEVDVKAVQGRGKREEGFGKLVEGLRELEGEV